LANPRGRNGKSQRNTELREQLPELEHIYRTAPVGLCLLDRDLRRLRINNPLAANLEQQRHWLANSYPVLSSAGIVLAICIVVQDITTRKGAESRLLEERLFSENVIEARLRSVDSQRMVGLLHGDEIHYRLGCFLSRI